MINHSLRDCLSALSKPVLTSILSELNTCAPAPPGLNHIDAQCVYSDATHSDQEESQLRAKLIHMLEEQEYLLSLYERMSRLEHEVLKLFIFDVGQDLFTYRQLEKGAGGMKPSRLRLGITALKRKGLIYSLRRQWGEVAYIMPRSLQDQFYLIIMKQRGFVLSGQGLEQALDESPASNSGIESLADMGAEYPSVCVDLFFILDHWRDQPQCSIPITQKGTVHKRWIRLWQERLVSRHLDLYDVQVQHLDTYTQQMAILLDFLTRKNMITWYPEQAQLNLDVVDDWMGSSHQEMKEQFIEYWCTVYVPSVPWLNRYLQDMRLTQRDQWLYGLSFVEQWEDRYDLPNVHHIRKQIVSRILEPLRRWGLIQVGQTRCGELVWKWRHDEENKTEVWLQPNMELYAPSWLPFASLWEITKCFHLQHWENMLVFNLSKEKAVAFVERGEEFSVWLQHLQKLSSTPVDSGLIRQLESWKKEQQKVRMTDKTVVHIEDVQLAKAFWQWPETEVLGVEKINTHYFLVDMHKREECVQLLSQKGIPIREEDQGAKSAGVPIQPELLHGSRTGGQSQIESDFPDLTEAIPVWFRLPDLWKKQLLAYHHQTKLEIIRQAVTHDLKMKVEDHTGKLIEMLPVDCRSEEGEWICTGMVGGQQPHTYPLEQIKKIQLLFPDLDESCYNDDVEV